MQGACTSLRETDASIVANLDDGTLVIADTAILATGHAVPAGPVPPLCGAWDFTVPPDPESTVAIIGTGLNMVDHVVTLLAAGHRGQILCISRRGLVPQVHAATKPLQLGRHDIPLGAPVSVVMFCLRRHIREIEHRGGMWRDAVDGLRPPIAAIWRGWNKTTRARFLRHAAAFWEVHRHRMPPASADRLDRARSEGQLRVLRGRFQRAVTQDDGRIRLDVARFGRVC